MVDVACQTEATAPPPPMPLPLQYPANLIYAQSMLAMCVSQLQQLETNKVLLHFYLWEHERRAAVASVLNTPILKPGGLNPPGSLMPETVPTNAPAAGEGAVAAGNATAAAAGRGGEAAPAAGEPQQQLEHLRLHRRRLAAAVKVALVMVLLEVRSGWFFVYFFAVFLYIGGLFDPFIQWFQHHSAQTTLDQQLAQLRNRQRRAAEDADGHHQDIDTAMAGATPPNSHANDHSASQRTNTSNDGSIGASVSVGAGVDASIVQNSVGNASGGNSSDVRGNNNSTGIGSKIGGSQNAPSTNTASTQSAGGGGTNISSNIGTADGSAPIQSGGLSDDAEGGATISQGSNSAAAAGETPRPVQGEEGPARPPWAHRFIYQLVVMFFMTLIPWWNPDPHYL